MTKVPNTASAGKKAVNATLALGVVVAGTTVLQGESSEQAVDHPGHAVVAKQTFPSLYEPFTIPGPDGGQITAHIHPEPVPTVEQAPAKQHVQQAPAKQHVEQAPEPEPLSEELTKIGKEGLGKFKEGSEEVITDRFLKKDLKQPPPAPAPAPAPGRARERER